MKETRSAQKCRTLGCAIQALHGMWFNVLYSLSEFKFLRQIKWPLSTYEQISENVIIDTNTL